MIEDRIISVLIGLVRACNNNPKTAATDSLVVKALAFPLLCPNCGDKADNSNSWQCFYNVFSTPYFL